MTPCARTASVRKPPLSGNDVHDVLAAEGGQGPTDPDLVAAAGRVAGDVLAPAAEQTDQAPAVPRSSLEALAAAGLFGVSCPPGLPTADTRRIFEALAGACGVTFFVWVQHHAPVRMLAGSGNRALRDRWLPDLCAGRALGGVAFGYLRRPGPPAVVARRVEGGLQVDGEAPWVTSWGLADVYVVGARLDDSAVFFLVPGTAGGGLRPSPPLALAAMNASCTVRLAFDGLVVPEGDVIATVPFERWLARDRVVTAQPNPAAFGITATCVRLLAEGAPGPAEDLGRELASCRDRAYGLADDGRTDEGHLRQMVEARAWSLELSVRAATALVSSVGGRALARDHPAQRLLREAAFFTIQAQTPALRDATLTQLTVRS